MWSFARSAVRAYRSSFVGSFLIVTAAAALLAANGVLFESGLRGDAPLLVTVAASFAGTAILVVVLVVASTFASALRQRSAQFALLRAVGATAAQVRSMVTAEVALVFAAAAPLGAVPGLFAANLLTPVLVSGGVLPDDVALTVSPLPALAALLLFPTALLAARLAAREVTRLSPTAAVRAAASESPRLSPARRITALGLLATGVLVAALPFFMPGTIGSAAGATSAFLIIGAAALAGPWVVGTIARTAARSTASSRNAAGVLALVNTRGFSRRLTSAIIPLALLLALGTVQTGVNGSLVAAAGLQLRDGLGSDVIVTSPDGVTAAQAEAVSSAPGVEAVASSVVAGEVKVDDDDDLGGLSWEQTGVRTVDGDTDGLIDLGVTAGSLGDLSGEATVATSGETLFGTGKNVGDTIDLRFDGVPAMPVTIVAVYERGLGFGEVVIAESSLPAEVRPQTADVLFARGAVDAASVGLQAVSVDEYADDAVASSASQQRLSAILLFVLIFFVAIAAANTLVMLTGARRQEFALLRRIGATRRQLASMVATESLFVIVTALVIGTVSVLPALVGVAYGMLGSFAVAIDWPVYGALVGAVVLIASVAMAVPARLATRTRW